MKGLMIRVAVVATVALVTSFTFGWQDGEPSSDHPWSTLDFSMTVSRTALFRGEPIEAIVTVANPGADPVDISDDGDDIFSTLGVFYTVGDEAKPRSFPGPRIEPLIGQPNQAMWLPGGASTQKTFRMLCRSRAHAEKVPGAGNDIPITSTPGTYRLWVGSFWDEVSQVSPSVEILVSSPGEKLFPAYEAFGNSKDLSEFYAPPGLGPESLRLVEGFLKEFPDSPYSDLAKCQLVRRAISRSLLAAVERERNQLVESPQDDILQAESLVAEIDESSFSLPMALADLKADVEKARKKVMGKEHPK